MSQTSSDKVRSTEAPQGENGQLLLAAGAKLAMRMWKNEAPTDNKPPSRHGYEVVGYAVSGVAELIIEGRTVRLEAGDSWLVPADAEHSYRIIEPFTAIEATAPPAGGRG